MVQLHAYLETTQESLKGCCLIPGTYVSWSLVPQRLLLEYIYNLRRLYGKLCVRVNSVYQAEFFGLG